MTKEYAIVTTEVYYDSYDNRQTYECFQEYDYDSFVHEVTRLKLENQPFRAFSIVPVTVTATVDIKIGR